MLTAEENERLTRVGARTPVGELLRRYWHPVAVASELETNPIKPVRLLGEDLVLFRDKSGRLGLIGDRCAHRRVKLQYGIPEIEGLRCPYHGWLYDIYGQCVEQPAEPSNSTLKDSIRIKAYRVEKVGGLIFGYIGPGPVPCLPVWDRLTWPNSMRAVGLNAIHANWLQAMENSPDTDHVWSLHGEYASYLLDRARVTDAGDPRRMLADAMKSRYSKVDYEFDHLGINRRVVVEGMAEDDDLWTVGQRHIFPGMTSISIERGGFLHVLQWIVPADDVTTMNYTYLVFDAGPAVTAPAQPSIPYFEVPIWEPDGSLSTRSVQAPDALVMEAQGPIVDRRQEHLATSDRGVIMFRRLVTEQTLRMERGEDPINVFRDPDEARHIELPHPSREAFGSGSTYQRGRATMGMVFDHPVIDVIEDLFEEAAAICAARDTSRTNRPETRCT